MIDSADIFDAHILIVDDQQQNIQLLEQLLNEAGYQNVSSTIKPLEACALHGKHGYDLILLDLHMTGMDSFQIMEDLKAGVVDDYLPVIVLAEQAEDKLQALQVGAKDFISKPFELLEIKSRIYNMLELRMLYRQQEGYNQVLEQKVLERTEELRISEARFRRLAELASDWYWEQDEKGNFSQVSGPVLEVLGMSEDALNKQGTSEGTNIANATGWNEDEREDLRARIAARQPFIDFHFSRCNTDGSQQKFRVSGEPMFGQNGRFIGYRGIGIELNGKR